MSESVQEFLARGGKIQKQTAGSQKTSTSSNLVKKDKKLKTLKSLLKQFEGDEVKTRKIEAAIAERYETIRFI